MMSHHLNSMLEHLKMGSLMSKGVKPANQPPAHAANGAAGDQRTSTPASTTQNHHPNGSCQNGASLTGGGGGACTGSGAKMLLTENNGSAVTGGGVPALSIAGDGGHHRSNHVQGGGGGAVTGYDGARKRCSISVQSSQGASSHGNGSAGDGNRSHYRELSPASLRIHRKSSHDIRNTLLGGGDGGEHGGSDGSSKHPAVVKPIKLKNLLNKAETYDTMHGKAPEVMLCSREVCLGSVLTIHTCGTEPRKSDVVLQHAKDFLDQYYSSIRRLKSPAHDTRWQQIQKEVAATGSYHLTETELIYGAKLAWRNSARCIGRIQWSKLQVFDCRYVTTTSGMFEAICNHIKYATNKGNLRSAITIFPQRTDGKHDYRIWNQQIISYAGYKNADGKIIGDPANVEFTDFCIKLGWKSKRTEWDILPLVVSANGHDPDYFDYPPDLILQVPLSHPQFKWFAELDLRWYAVPMVSGMLFDCGGIQFTATAFSGWYMSTEIGCRNLCDTNRRNLLEPIAIKMGLDTRNPTSLWKDKALVEINIAVLHSYQSRNITIVDHHTASESFMKHCENETKLRNGCPADWIWIVPPMSASVTPVFHQEMALYYLRPSFEYQESAMKTHCWKKEGGRQQGNKKPRRKFNFKQIARAVKFTSKLFGRALSRRIKATVLYATETGRSEAYARQLVELLGHAFNAQIYSMADYDISSIEHEALLLLVASTFGNGDPPENGQYLKEMLDEKKKKMLFAQDLYAMKLHESGNNHGHSELSIAASSRSFIKANSRSELPKCGPMGVRKMDRLDSLRGSTTDTLSEETFGPLSNVRFAVFALGSSAYPNFAAFGKYLDNILGELGGERILKLATGDEICGQEQAFRKWAPEVFKVACETFCLDPEETLSEGVFTMQNELNEQTVRYTPVSEEEPLDRALSKYHNKKAIECRVKRTPISLQDSKTEKSTISVEIVAEGVDYEPGDHVGIFPANRKDIVDGIIERLVGVTNPDEILQLQLLKEKQTANGVYKAWEPHERIPSCSLRTLLTRYLDITTPPTRQLLTYLATCCSEKSDEERLTMLANESSVYEDWRHWKLPHLLEVLEEFPSCHPPAAVLVAQLSPLQPRFYSISSSPRKYPNEIHLTVAIVKYRAQDGSGAEHYGVTSNYLADLDPQERLLLFVRSAPSFHMPKDPTKPIILIGPGTGIAPFRSFWQEWLYRKLEIGEQIPKVWLFFGSRTRSLDLYRDEKEEMVQQGILDRVFLALSREKDIPKTYVQDLALKEADAIAPLILREKGHVYVCGDVTMAEHVYQTLRKILATYENKTETEMEKYMLTLRDENRYHEDIFGITLRTAEIHNKSRANARIRMGQSCSS
ncbi:nitric oxide synthase isoform X1 [Anopheles aquasalis]|uniref:nitric oxide synthase isoform X1 n=1 Tax=Anopheles aquasalis TaxID=42839 RepID=UPI00215B563B|nr:nitric oxide synthase isoform X1 [Anopheles aquasalis]